MSWKFTKVYFIIVIWLFNFTLLNTQRCSISLKDIDPALVVTDETYHFLYPTHPKGDLNITSNQKIHLICPEGKPTLAGKTVPDESQCVNRQLKNSKQIIPHKSVDCPEADRPAIEVKPSNKLKTACSLQHYREFQLGIGAPGIFLPLITVCFNKQTKLPVFVHSTVTKYVLNRPKMKGKGEEKKRPKFIDRGKNFGKYKLGQMYEKKNQAKRLNNKKGKVIDKRRVFLARGHLAPNADFVYRSQRDVTFDYSNTAPQWQPFNTGPWKSLEDGLRKFAKREQKDLEIMTGVFGEARLKGTNLHLQDNDRHNLTVPKWFWKIGHNSNTPATKYVFFGYNSVTADFEAAKRDFDNECSRSTPMEETSIKRAKIKRDKKKGFLFVCAFNAVKNAQIKSVIKLL